jgi:hypothetical protein
MGFFSWGWKTGSTSAIAAAALRPSRSAQLIVSQKGSFLLH